MIHTTRQPHHESLDAHALTRLQLYTDGPNRRVRLTATAVPFLLLAVAFQGGIALVVLQEPRPIAPPARAVQHCLLSEKMANHRAALGMGHLVRVHVSVFSTTRPADPLAAYVELCCCGTNARTRASS
jgi:hypothetical protein